MNCGEVHDDITMQLKQQNIYTTLTVEKRAIRESPSELENDSLKDEQQCSSMTEILLFFQPCFFVALYFE